MVTTNSFMWDKSEYLIIVDYHSRYFEVAKLPDTKNTTVITYTNPCLPNMEYHLK